MPGLLKSTARCPQCGDPLRALVDQTSFEHVRRTYYHDKRHPKVRRMMPCKMLFDNHALAARERRNLEVTTPPVR